MRKLSRYILIFALILLTVGQTAAAGESEAEKELKNRQSEVQGDMRKAKDLLDDTQTQKSDVMQEILQLDIQLDEAETELDFINGELERTTALLEKTEQELTDAETAKETQYETLKSRIQYMHENGSVSYIEILLQSSSLSDFLNRLEYIDAIVSYDNEMVGRLRETEILISQKLDEITAKKTEVETLQSRQTVKMRTLEEAIAAKDAVIYELTRNEASFVQQIKDLEESDVQIQQLIKEAEAKRLAEEKAAREKAEREAREKAEREAREKAEREAAEKAAREAAEAEERARANQALANQTKYSGGAFSWPVPGNYDISSGYGNRINPISGLKEFHTGIDIPAPKGTNIVAAASGTVIYAGYKGGYGYTVIIDHGGGVTTLYGHNSKIVVSEGEAVGAGEVIAKCGSTGYSTGPHSHFEVREGGGHTSPLGYLQ